MDYCFAPILSRDMRAIVYTRAANNYKVLVTANNVQADFLKECQDFVVPQKSVERLGVDRDECLVLKPSGHAWRRGDDIDGGRSTNSLRESASDGEPVPSFDDKYPNAQDYNDYRSDEHSKDYEAIMIHPRDSPTKSLSPRPDQPPPPPPAVEAAEPVYSTIDKSAKKPQQQQQREDPSNQAGDSMRPKPPPLDTMPSTDGGSPAVITIQSKPQRPSAPPKRKGSEAAEGFKNMTGNMATNGKDDVLTPPPRGTTIKTKLRLKSDSTKF